MSLDTDLQSVATSLKKEIFELEAILNEKKHALFITRLSKMYNISLNETITDIKINVSNEEPGVWFISYTHKTKNYNISDYVYEQQIVDDTDNDTIELKKVESDISAVTNDTENSSDLQSGVEQTEKITQVTFGKSKKHFIKGGIKYNIYRNSDGELRIINSDYDLELDMDGQKQLIARYANNKNIPECMALSVFLYMSYNKWDDISIINYLSVV